MRAVQLDDTEGRHIRGWRFALSSYDQRQAKIAKRHRLIAGLEVGEMRIDWHFNGNASRI
jgi:hypothetical protein